MSAACIVTGASGYLGGVVLRSLSGHRAAVGIAHGHPAPGLMPCDLTDRGAVKELLAGIRPELVIHCAAWRDPDRCEEFPEAAARINTDAVRYICEALPSPAVFMLISTDYVFDGTRPPYAELDPVSPVNVYGWTKVRAEEIALARGNSLVIRCPLLIGQELEGQRGFFAQMADAIRSGRPAEVDDVLVRFPVFGPDVSAAIEFLTEKKAAGIFHVSGESGGTRWHWTQRMAALMGLPTDHLRPSKDIVQRKAARPLNSQLSSGKIRRLGFEQFTPFDEIVRETVRHGIIPFS